MKSARVMKGENILSAVPGGNDPGKVKEFQDFRMAHRIEDLRSFFAPGQETGRLHQVEMAGDVALLVADRREDFADAAFSVPEEFEDGDTCLLSEGAEDVAAGIM